MVQIHGVDADQRITDGRQARYDVTLVLVAAAETLAGPLAEFFGPIRDGQVAVHPAQGCAGSNG